MEIPRKLLDQLTEELNAFSAAGRQMVLNAIANAEWSDVSELRAIVVEVMEMVCGEMTDLAAARSAEFYDGVREMSTGEALGALVESGRIPGATDGAVRALVQSVVDSGSTEQFARALGDRVDYEVKKAAGDCAAYNASRDKLKPRFARVPAGGETCPFCFMLASRGFVYATERKAGGDGHYHPHCNCRIVPGFDGMDVEGYDPDGMYDQWKSCLDTLGGRDGIRAEWNALPKLERDAYIARNGGKSSDAFDAFANSRLAREISTRDPKWLYDGVPSPVAKERGAKPNPDERTVADTLSRLGFRTEFVAEPREKFVKSPDARLNGKLWEFKIPAAYNEKTIKNQFKKSLGKGTSKLLVSNYANGADAAAMVSDIRRILSSGEFEEIDEALFVGAEGMLVRLKRRRPLQESAELTLG